MSRSVAAARRGPSPLLVVGVLIVVVFAAFVGFGVYRAGRPGPGAAVIPANATATGVVVGSPSAKATIDLYFDFQCPVCRGYEAQSGPTIDQLVTAGQAKIDYHPMAFLDDYSARASAASGVAAADGVYPQFVKLLFAEQPPEGSAGLTNAQLVDALRQAGATGDVAAAVNDGRYAGWTSGVTDAASQAGVNATPTVLVDGKPIDHTDAALRQAVAADQS